MKKKNDEQKEVFVTEVNETYTEVFIVGKTPLIINRMAEKARQELLLPKGRKTAAEKASNLKHDPYTEFRSSAYVLKDESLPTYLAMPAAAPKRALASAALDIQGAKKAQIGRLTYIEGNLISVYGYPKLLMSVVRNSDPGHTPDIRSRCIVEKWAMFLKICYVTPIIKPTTVFNLLRAAGLYIGIGDWRPEKGAGSYGQFYPLPPSKKDEIADILEFGREAQIDALKNPEAFDDETKELLDWFDVEVRQRGHDLVGQLG